jgi:hypothetical protein
MKRFRRRGEEGVTLTELLAATLLTALIMVPLANSIFIGLRINATTQNRVDESNDANKLSWYFAPDVQNATAVATNVTESSACPAPMTVGLLLTTPNGSVSYYRGAGTDQTKLFRRTCSGGTATRPLPLLRYLSAAPTFTISNDTFGNWQLVTAQVVQRKALDANAYTSTVQASRRGN